jgi:hypothetical protein
MAAVCCGFAIFLAVGGTIMQVRNGFSTIGTLQLTPLNSCSASIVTASAKPVFATGSTQKAALSNWLQIQKRIVIMPNFGSESGPLVFPRSDSSALSNGDISCK